MIDIEYIKKELAEILEQAETIDVHTYDRLCHLYDEIDAEGGVLLNE